MVLKSGNKVCSKKELDKFLNYGNNPFLRLSTGIMGIVSSNQTLSDQNMSHLVDTENLKLMCEKIKPLYNEIAPIAMDCKSRIPNINQINRNTHPDGSDMRKASTLYVNWSNVGDHCQNYF